MRTEQQIVQQIRTVRTLGEPHGDWALYTLGPFLSTEAWAEFKPASQHDQIPLEREEVLGHISHAVRSGVIGAIAHSDRNVRRHAFVLSQLAWLLGDTWLTAFALSRDNWPMFGMPIFAMFAEVYGVNVLLRQGELNMAQGSPCSALCDKGCI